MGSVGGVRRWAQSGVWGEGWGWSKDGRRVGGLVNSRFLSFYFNAGMGEEWLSG